jgi:hypothetical protein
VGTTAVVISRLLKNAHLPFDRPFDTLRVPSNVEGLMALRNVEGRRCPHSSARRRRIEIVGRLVSERF